MVSADSCAPHPSRKKSTAKSGSAIGCPASGWPGGTISVAFAHAASSPTGSDDSGAAGSPTTAVFAAVALNLARCRRCRSRPARRAAALFLYGTDYVTPGNGVTGPTESVPPHRSSAPRGLAAVPYWWVSTTEPILHSLCVTPTVPCGISELLTGVPTGYTHKVLPIAS